MTDILRPYRALARELGLSERQFHRRLDAGDAEARALLRQELVWSHRTTLANEAAHLDDIADTFRRTDPDLCTALVRVAKAMRTLADTKPSRFRIERERRLQDLAEVDGLTDEDYDRIAADLDNLPPTPKEWRKRQDADLTALTLG